MRATNAQPIKESNKKWLIPVLLLIISLVMEGLFSSILYNISHEPILSAQKLLYDKILNLFIYNKDASPSNETNGTVVNTTALYDVNFLEINNEISLAEKVNKSFSFDKIDKSIAFGEIFHFVNSNNFYLILCAILYNFFNVYKIFILCNSVFLANFLSSTLCFIFHSPRPFMVYYKIKPVFLYNDWGSPNTQMVVLIAFCLTLFKVIKENKEMEKKLWALIIFAIFLGIISFIDIFLIFASGNASINQLIFSIIIAVVTYQFIFILYKIDVNKTRQFYDFIKIKALNYIIVNLLLFMFQIILYQFIKTKNDEAYYKDHINIQQYSEGVTGILNYRKLFYLDDSNFCNVICFLMNIISFLAMKADLYWIYKGNYDDWCKGNFERTKLEVIDNFDQSGEFSAVEGTQWNHNGFVLSFIRFIVLIVLIILCFLPSMFIYYLNSESEFFGIIFLITIPLILLEFGTFYLFKIVFLSFKLGRKLKK